MDGDEHKNSPLAASNIDHSAHFYWNPVWWSMSTQTQYILRWWIENSEWKCVRERESERIYSTKIRCLSTPQILYVQACMADTMYVTPVSDWPQAFFIHVFTVFFGKIYCPQPTICAQVCIYVKTMHRHSCLNQSRKNNSPWHIFGESFIYSFSLSFSALLSPLWSTKFTRQICAQPDPKTQFQARKIPKASGFKPDDFCT